MSPSSQNTVQWKDHGLFIFNVSVAAEHIYEPEYWEKLLDSDKNTFLSEFFESIYFQ